jgi:transposase
MGGKSPMVASDEQRVVLAALAGSRDRGEADRARAVLLTLSGWTSPQIAEAFGVREDTVRLWRSDFGRGGVDALTASVAPGPPPVKSETALRVVTPLLEESVANRKNWTIPRLRAEINLYRCRSPRPSHPHRRSRPQPRAHGRSVGQATNLCLARSGRTAIQNSRG